LFHAGTSGIYVDPLLKRQKIEDMAPHEFLSIPISDLTQTGSLIAGEVIVNLLHYAD